MSLDESSDGFEATMPTCDLDTETTQSIMRVSDIDVDIVLPNRVENLSRKLVLNVAEEMFPTDPPAAVKQEMKRVYEGLNKLLGQLTRSLTGAK